MNWITTNIRLPEDLYMQLKIEAAQKRKSVGAVVREILTGKQGVARNNRIALLERMRTLAKDIAEENKGNNFTRGLIEMRYEQ